MYRSALTNSSLPWAEMLNFSSCGHQGSSAEGRNGHNEALAPAGGYSLSLQGDPWQVEASSTAPPTLQGLSLSTASNSSCTPYASSLSHNFPPRVGPLLLLIFLSSCSRCRTPGVETASKHSHRGQAAQPHAHTHVPGCWAMPQRTGTSLRAGKDTLTLMSDAFSSMAWREDTSACDTEKSFSAALAAFNDATWRSYSI